MTIEKMISEKDIQIRVKELSDEINKYYNNGDLYVICVLKGAVMFTCDLVKNLTMPVTLDFLIASSYGNETFSSEHVDIIKDIDVDIANKKVLVIDDIKDTGYTLNKLIEHLSLKSPKEIKTCTLFSKRGKSITKADFVGFELGDEFIIGYGLDYKQKYRNLPYVGKLVK